MPDPAIREFFETRRDELLKKEIKESMTEEEKDEIFEKCFDRFSPENWLPDAAKRAGQIKLSSHPCTFSHPSARKNNNGYVTPVISIKNKEIDGYLRTGNINAETDALGNAAALDVYKFLSLEMKDGSSLLEHIESETSVARDLLTIPTDTYENLRNGFLTMIRNEGDETITSSKIKQVYFPIDSDKYHLLSILTNSGIVYELRERIDTLRFSEEQKEMKQKKRNNEYSEKDYIEIINTLTIGYGGTKPQNISVLNNNHGGKAKMFLSVPPVLNKREIRFPKRSFFFESIRYYHVKEALQRLHAIFKSGVDSVIPRKNLESGRDNRIEEILDMIILRMSAIRSVSSEQYYEKTSELAEHQKIWLLEENNKKRQETDEWLIKICNDISKWIVDAYKKTVKNPVILGAAEIHYIEEIVTKNKEALR